jgi:hypothetical protein
MIVWLRHFLGWVVGAFRSREDIILEKLALRQLCSAKTSAGSSNDLVQPIFVM